VVVMDVYDLIGVAGFVMVASQYCFHVQGSGFRVQVKTHLDRLQCRPCGCGYAHQEWCRPKR
jgi:hypothetical protein